MQLCFKNNYSSLVSVALMWYDPNGCGGEGGNWATEGWWNINPGDEVHTNVWTANRYFCFYAEAQNGAVWNGPYGPVYATPQQFRGCVNIGSTADTLLLGMRQVDAGWWFWSYVTYTPSTSTDTADDEIDCRAAANERRCRPSDRRRCARLL